MTTGNGHYVTAMIAIGNNKIMIACKCGAIITGHDPGLAEPSVIDKWVLHRG